MPARRSGSRKPARHYRLTKAQVRRDKATVKKLFPFRGIHMMSEKALHEIAGSMRKRGAIKKSKKR